MHLQSRLFNGKQQFEHLNCTFRNSYGCDANAVGLFQICEEFLHQQIEDVIRTVHVIAHLVQCHL